MSSKFCLCLFFIIFLNNVSGGRISRSIDETDIKLTDQTGCKYLYLPPRETVFFIKGDLAHTTMATLSEEPLQSQNQTTFRTKFAIRTGSDLHVLMFTRPRLQTSQLNGDYEIGFGTQGNQKSFIKFSVASETGGFGVFQEEFTRNMLSNERYVPLYIDIDPENLTFGKQCERQPIYTTNNFSYKPIEIVKFGFQARADHGARILYDCPANFADCSGKKIFN